MEEIIKDKTENGKVSFETNLGTIQVEGSEAFVTKTMQNILDQLKNSTSTKPAKSDSDIKQKVKSKSKTKAKKIFTPEYLPDLIKKEQIDSLKKFFQDKQPQSHQDSYLCAAYWLKKELSSKDVSANEIYTIYKTLNKRIPEHINQVFRDAKTSRSFFGITPNKDLHYFITPLGEQYVELDLPKVVETKNNGN